MQTYVFRAGHWVDKTTGEPMAVDMTEVKSPRAIIRDIEPHMGPNGRVIRSRSDLADLRARDGWVPHERVGIATTMPKGTWDDRSDHWQDWKQSTKQKVAKRAGLDGESLKTEAEAREVFGSLRDRVAKGTKSKPEVVPRERIRERVAARLNAKSA